MRDIADTVPTIQGQVQTGDGHLAFGLLPKPASGIGIGHPVAASGARREKLDVQPYDLVPFQELTEAYIRVGEFGAKKYDGWNWSKGLPQVQLISSLLRHTFAYLRGEECDKDSGLSHVDHILWNAVTLARNVHWNLEDGRRAEPHRSYEDQVS